MLKENQEFTSIIFEPMGRRIKVKLGDNILRSALRSGIGIRNECGGIFGKCGKCKIIIKDQSNLNSPTKVERELLGESELKKGYRLACQSIIRGEVRVFVPEESKIRKRRLQIFGIKREVRLKPTIKKLHIKIPHPSIQDNRSDVERITSTIKEVYNIHELKFNLEVLRELPKIARDANWDLTITLMDDGTVISVEPRDTTNSLYGVAIDLGTSKIVASLIDLINGNLIMSNGFDNPQVIYGEDIISRITYAAIGKEQLDELKRLAVEGVNSIVTDLCKAANVDINNVYEIVLVGNTVMHHLFLGLETKYLGLSPYVPVINDQLNLRANELNIQINNGGRVYLPPVIAGFIGSDNTADLLSTNFYEIEDMSLMIDLGTNTEINLGNKDEILCCSCASGPAFEGGHIKHGMKAVEGAIEKVSINHQTYEAHYKTIGGLRPIGICGSAMIDLLAEMLKCGLIDNRGRYRNEVKTPRLRKGEFGYEYVVAWFNETDIG
ncbi:MAG: ASKHA domain-containing protein, partial [Nitrososphaerales archaeon]